MKTILSTKKLKKSEYKKLTDANINVIEHKFIKTKKIDFIVKTLNEYVIFSSKNAVKNVLKNRLEKQIKERKIFCVGQKTKQFLEKHHFIVQECADYSSDLGSIIIENYKNHSFTFFSGNLRKDDLPNILNENYIIWNEVEVYKTTLSPKEITDKVDGILFFSPSAVKSFLMENKLKNQTCFCIGTTTAKALENKTNNIKIASKPSIEEVISTVINTEF